MANRKSWRRAVAPASGQTRTTPPSATMRPQKSASNGATFQGVDDPAMASMLAVVYAKDVTLRESNGAEYTGLFTGMERPPKSEPHVVLLYARILRTASSGPSSAVLHEVRRSTARKLLVPLSRVLHVTAAAKDVEALKNHTGEDGRAGNKGGFMTDGEITRGSAGAGRQLQRFDDFTDLSSPIATGPGAQTLDEETFGDLAASNGGGKKWDQFQVNEDKFGVRTTFDEDEYTTKIDRHDVKFEERQREAARLASEIENKTSDNVHIRQERNQETGGDYDEEKLHSGVQRPVSADGDAKNASAKATENSRETKPVQPEKPRLSYAAAAASSMKAAPVALNSNAQNAHPSGKPAMIAKAGPMSRSNSTPKQAVQPKQNNASKQAQVSRQPPSSKQAPAPKQPVPSKQTPGAKTAPSKQNATLRQPQTPKGTGGTKVGSTQGGGQGSKQAQPGRQTMPNSTAVSSGTTANAAKQTTQASTVSSPVTENKERDIPEKKSKVSGPRKRSSRENLPQLVKVMTSIKGRTSPNQSRNSPLPTHATADTSAVAVLNLDAQTPNLGADKIKRFEEFKTNREIRSIAENREKITDDLKKFSTQLDSRNGQLRRSQSSTGSSGNTTNSSATAEKKSVETSPKAEEKTESPGKVAEQKVEDNREPETVASNGGDTTTKPKLKLKSKLNPNAQEFKPDAPSFKPSSQKAASANQVPQNFSPYTVNTVPAEYSQPMQAPHQGYPVPMQAMGQISYGQPPYGLIAPGAVPVGVPPGSSAYQFMQGPPTSFHGSQVPARFGQGAAVPASYPYPHMNPTMPMVMAQAPQRIPAGAYAYYNAGPYGAGQVPGSPQIPPSPQQAVYAATSQSGLPHLQGGVPMSGRGGHGHARRAGGGRRGGKHQGGQQSHSVQENGAAMSEKVTPRADGAVTAETNQR